jgi:vancomycin permeability regulator SanA
VAVAERHPVLRWGLRLAALLAVAAVVYLGVTFVQVVSASRADERSPSDAIVVLGAAQYDGRPSPVLRQRLDHALALYRAGVAPRLVLTGSKQPGDRYTEAFAGYRYLAEHGVPKQDLTLVDDGSSTWDSMRAADRVLARSGADHITLVSDSYHSRRLEGIAAELGMSAQVSPTGSSPSVPDLVRETGLVAVGQIVGYGRLLRWAG